MVTDRRVLIEAKDRLREIGSQMTIDSQASGLLCPFCQGGSSGERSFSASRTYSGVLYSCHRAGCGEKGILDMLLLEHKPRVMIPKKNPINGMTFSPMPDDVRAMLKAKYHINEHLFYTSGIRWISSMRRIGIPIKRSTGISIGLTARSVDPKDKPKSLIFLHAPDAVLGSFYMHDTRSSKIWIVEDQFSAMRISEYENVVALLGSKLSESLVTELKRIGMNEIVVCLDADAFDKTVEIGIKYKGQFNHISIRKPKKDPKDMTSDELQKLIKEK